MRHISMLQPRTATLLTNSTHSLYSLIHRGPWRTILIFFYSLFVSLFSLLFSPVFLLSVSSVFCFPCCYPSYHSSPSCRRNKHNERLPRRRGRRIFTGSNAWLLWCVEAWALALYAELCARDAKGERTTTTESWSIQKKGHNHLFGD
jgi:hypothetical protein